MEKSMETIGLYIHIPFCVRKCQYCDFCSYEGKLQHADAYVDAVLAEAKLRADEAQGRAVDTVFFGGGTPSLLTGEQMERLLGGLKEPFRFAQDAEISMEANPGTVTGEKLRAYRKAGINRLSIGVQATQDHLLETLGRIHRFRDAQRALEEARDAGFSRISLDLMTGLPGQRKGDLADSLRWVIAQQVEHISLYSLIIEEGTPFFELHERGELLLPDEETERQIFEEACELLRKAGYERYEISNFAKPGRACRHNIRYWKREDYLGLGVAAVSQFADQRIKNGEDLESYLHNLEAGMLPEQEIERVCAEDLCFETVMLALRMAQGLEYAAFETEFGPAAAALARELAARWEIQGFASPDPARLRLTPAGRS